MSQDNRIHFLDALRGYALMGLFLIHMIEYFELYWRQPAATPELINTVLFGIFGGKAYAIFAFLFGISFFIILNNQTKRGVDFRLRFLWRLTILFVLGYLHALIYGGEVLQILALCGLLLIPLWFAPNWLVLVASLFFLLQMPAWGLIAWLNQSDIDISKPFFSMYQPHVYDVYATGSLWELLAVNSWQGNATKWLFMWESGRLWTICGLSLLGFLLARLAFFSDFKRHQSRFNWGLVIFAVLFALLHFGQDFIAAIPHAEKTARLFFGIFGAYENLTITLFSVCAFLVLYHLGADKILRYLAPPGRMTLSIYISQSIIGVFIFYGCGLNGWTYLGQMNSFLLGVFLWVLQIVFAIWWFKYFRFGPLEWLWRAATYTSFNIPFKK
nr:hypothetical protein [uncultured bacterium]